MKTVKSVAHPSDNMVSTLADPPSNGAGSKLVPLTDKTFIGSLDVSVQMAFPEIFSNITFV